MENKGIIMEKFPQLWKSTPQLWRNFHNCGNYHHKYGRGFVISGKSMPKVSIIMENFGKSVPRISIIMEIFGKSLPRISIIMETFVTLYHNYGR